MGGCTGLEQFAVLTQVFEQFAVLTQVFDLFENLLFEYLQFAMLTQVFDLFENLLATLLPITACQAFVSAEITSGGGDLFIIEHKIVKTKNIERSELVKSFDFCTWSETRSW